jgi:Mannosyltransferase (PIG-V)
MNPETVELAVVEPAREAGVAPQGRPASARDAGVARVPSLARLRADPERMAAVRDSWRVLWTSRLIVWAAGIGAVGAFGLGSSRGALDPPGLTRGFGWLGDLLAAPAARWDSDWYLVIARYGYRPDLGPFTAPRTAYFPLYPLGMRVVGFAGVPLLLAGVLLSLCAFALALYGIHRLTTLELSRAAARGATSPRAGEVARLAVIITAFSPMAFFFSAVYTDSLYMALSVALFWSARQGRWLWVGLLGGLAAATRSTGLMLLVPALIIYLYGPREDRAADRPGGAGGSRLERLLRPRYRVRRDVLWLALVPTGIALSAAGWRWRAATRSDPSTPSSRGRATSSGPTSACGTARWRASTASASCCRCRPSTSTSRSPAATRTSRPGTT